VRIPLYLIWAGHQRKDELRTYQAFWAITAKGDRLATMLSLNTDRILQQESVLGFRAVNDLVNCAVTGQPSQLLAGTFASHDDYYSATLFMLTVRAATERLPHCRGGLSHALKPVTCAEGPECPLHDPIVARVGRAPFNVRLVDVAQLPSTKARRPLVRVSSITHAGDGSARLFIVLREGQVRILKAGRLLPEAFLDLVALRRDFRAAGGELGLASVAFHPEFSQRNRAGTGRFYTLHAESPVSDGRKVLAGLAGRVHHHSVVMEWRVQPAQPDRVDPGSGREVMRIAQPAVGRNAGHLGFNPMAKPRDADYGLLYIGLGDGGATTREGGDREAQDRNSPLGKVLRVDPLAGAKSSGYRIPATNPYAKPDSGALPEIWAIGLRAPGPFTWDRAAPGKLLLPDVGDVIQEINVGEAGRNYGWSERQGTFIPAPGNAGRVLPPSKDEGARGFTYPVVQYDADEGTEIGGGEVYRGRGVPALVGKYFFADVARG
jgi:hypothetical protein